MTIYATDLASATPAARRTDPATSHAAADAAVIQAAKHKELILVALIAHGPLGKDGIARVTGLSGVEVARRLADLAKDERAEPTGRTVKSDAGRAEREWRVLL